MVACKCASEYETPAFPQVLSVYPAVTPLLSTYCVLG